MARIATYVFMDIETTGLPKEENNKTRITEISFVAVKRCHVLDTRPGSSPRVQQKITLCLNPGRMIQPIGTEITGLCNDILEYELKFNIDVFNILNTFLNVLTKPVCLIAQNGLAFDYPILKNHIAKLGQRFSEDLLCADCYHGFYDILEKQKKDNLNLINTKAVETQLDTDLLAGDNTLNMKAINETTPKQKVCSPVRKNGVSKVVRRFPWSQGEKPKERYKLKDIYERLLNRPCIEAHRAENDCKIALECAIAVRKEFVEWVDGNHCLFSEVKAMQIGVPLGLLILTGVLWGCTNPFIRQGTKGLRSVQAKSLIGQAYAEVVFLLGNWRYVVPWLVNQSGSLAYLAAIQRVPLSVAVPAANSMAFALTAVTGAVIGSEEPLDRVAVLGVTLIVAGTFLCCMDL